VAKRVVSLALDLPLVDGASKGDDRTRSATLTESPEGRSSSITRAPGPHREADSAGTDGGEPNNAKTFPQFLRKVLSFISTPNRTSSRLKRMKRL
jgi:hypothetical protein